MNLNSISSPGIILYIDKPLNWTSNDVVRKVRKLLHTKKVGHAGTLDPLATGLLIVCVHRSATKRINEFMDMPKEYEATINLTAFSETDDAQGPLHPVPHITQPSIEKVTAIVQSFLGTQQQMPPKFSALKVDGKRAYDLARAGKEVMLQPRTITIHDIKITDYTWPNLSLIIQCSKGTYIRSIARDIGEKLQTGGYISQLRRTAIGPYQIKDAQTIDTLEKLYPQNVQ